MSRSGRKQADHAKEIVSLMAQLHAGASKTIKSKVMRVLSQQPETRNNDVLLTVSLYKMFYPHLVSDGRIALDDLFRLPTQFEIQRLRAHFQNTLGLFLASPDVREKRLQNQKKKREQFGTENQGAGVTLNLFLDRASDGQRVAWGAFSTVQVGDEPMFDLALVQAAMGMKQDVRWESADDGVAAHYPSLLRVVLAQAEPWSARGVFGNESSSWEMARWLVAESIAGAMSERGLQPPFRVRVGVRTDDANDASRVAELAQDLEDALQRVPELRGIKVEWGSGPASGIMVAELLAGAFVLSLSGLEPEVQRHELAAELLRELGSAQVPGQGKTLWEEFGSGRRGSGLGATLYGQLGRLGRRRGVQLSLPVGEARGVQLSLLEG